MYNISYNMASRTFHQYLDLDVFNDDADANTRPPQLSFEETRTHPILEGDSSDYFVTSQIQGTNWICFTSVYTIYSDRTK